MRGLSEYPRLMFKVDAQGVEACALAIDADDKAAKRAAGWQTRHIAWCDGPLPAPEPEPEPDPKPKGRKAAAAE